MSTVVLTKNYTHPPINKKEILRYAGCGQDNAKLNALVDDCIAEAENSLSYRVCYCELNLEIKGNCCNFGEFCVESNNLAKNLDGCKKVILFAATVGMELDRIIAKYSRIEPSKAIILHALGAERVEALCDAFCEDIAKEKQLSVRPRFSAGYGDLKLCTQKDIFSVLECSKHIGIFLNDSLLMTPSKSVTAFVGLEVNGEGYEF